MPPLLLSAKGQIISKVLFGVLEFSQKMNEQVRCGSKNEFVSLSFGGKVIIEKSRGEGSLMEQDTFENVS